MQIVFSPDKTSLIFKHESPTEYKAIQKFPAFVKDSSLGIYHAVPTILPVAYNVVIRCRKTFKKVQITQEVQDWLDKPFRLKEIPASFKFFTEPKDFQHLALRFLYTLGSAGLLLDPGMGKSKVVVDYIALKQFERVVIVCPAALLFVWEDEFVKHRPDVSYYTIKSTDWDAEKAGVLSNTVTIINYNKAVILKHRLKEVGYQFIHVDEFLIKDPSTSRTQAITEISKGIPHRCGGSGTLINNTPLDGFAPMRYLQPALVGWNFRHFMDKYAVMKDSTRNMPSGESRKVVVAYRGQDEIRSMLESCSIVMTKDKWLKLPEKKFEDVYVQMAPDQKEAYYQLMKNYYLNLDGKEMMVDNPLVMLSKLYQISQGFLYFNKESELEVQSELLATEEKRKKKPKVSDREVHFFQDQPKVEALRELLTGKLLNTKCIIWFNLGAELTFIESLLKKLGNKYLVIKGGEKDIGGKVRTFNKSTDIPWLVCQSKSVNYGITVLGSKKEDLEAEGLEVLPDLDPSVCNEVFFSMSFSLEIYLQQQDRIHRLGQEHVCTYYRIFANNPVERKIREAISTKMAIKEDMLRDVAESILKEVEEI
jgi:SNF2 family DNA or RNA helicase